jgi:hypothetical protein
VTNRSNFSAKIDSSASLPPEAFFNLASYALENGGHHFEHVFIVIDDDHFQWLLTRHSFNAPADVPHKMGSSGTFVSRNNVVLSGIGWGKTWRDDYGYIMG